jgi:LPS-assembly protein
MMSGRPARLARLCGATAMACVLAVAMLPAGSTRAQMLGNSASIPAGRQMLLESDNLVFNRDDDTVTAEGNVQIEYGGNHLVAKRVTYDRKTRRLLASGNVEIVDEKKNHIFADEMDVTDDFRDGFVNALNVETADKTYVAADSAKREGGVVTTFNRGVYTACAPCEDKPDKPPIWRIKARTIVWNGQSKTIRFLHSRFDLFGLPIAYFSAFEIPDPTVKRKTGFLMPAFSMKSELGFGTTQPFYVALAPTYDLTLKPTYYTRQGFMGEAEFRQRFNNGGYSITIAGIHQNNPDAFKNNTVDKGAADDPNKWRGMVGTKGRFEINPRWTFGWDMLFQSDKNFASTYGIDGYSQYYRRSEAYLTGLNDRNYFDLRAMHFDVQEATRDSSSSSYDKKQPWVLPAFEYSYTPSQPVAGGELNFNVNTRAIWRNRLDYFPNTPAVRGIDGSDSRITAEAVWRRTFITEGGLLITPLLALRGDAIGTDYSDETVDAIRAMAANPLINTDADVRSAYYRFMATAGMELSWPILFSTTSASHVLEPVAQIFARPDEPYSDSLGIPNEDAQSFVFDASSLFDRDKFSGLDRIEGGTRANLGFRYSGSFDSGWSATGIFGQSFQLAGRNSFAAPDLVNAGAYSGLETARSDYVALVGMTSPDGLSLSTGGRFDEETLGLRRIEASAAYVGGRYNLAARYAYIDAQPLYGFPDDRQQITAAASAKVGEYWRVFGSATYDTVSKLMISDALGMGYLDECFGLTLSVSQTRNSQTRELRNNIGFNISFRTIGDFGSNSASMRSQ